MWFLSRRPSRPPNVVTLATSDMVCRLIPWDQWDVSEGRPLPGVFKASSRKPRDLSVWHLPTLDRLGSIDDVKCDPRMRGAGEARLTIADCVRLAQECDVPFEVAVELRPEGAYGCVKPYAPAHAQLEAMLGREGFTKSYRYLLAETADVVSPSRTEA